MKKITILTFTFLLVLSGCKDKQDEDTAANKKEEIKEYASYGATVVPDNALSPSEMLDKYKAMKKGDTLAVQFKSTINEVCKKKGCWMKMGLADDQASFVRFKDYGFFVPLNADKSEAIVGGRAYLDIVSVDELKHFAKDGGKSQAEIDQITEPETTYAFQADGVLIQK